MDFDTVYSDSDLNKSDDFDSLHLNFPKFIDGVDDSAGIFAPFLTTSKATVKRTMELLKGHRYLLELGSGDGRFCVAALMHPFNFEKAVGIEVEIDLVEKARQRALKCSLPQQPKFVHSAIQEINFDQLLLEEFKLTQIDSLKELVIVIYMLGGELQLQVQQLVLPFFARNASLVSIVFPLDKVKPTYEEKGIYIYSKQLDIPICNKKQNN